MGLSAAVVAAVTLATTGTAQGAPHTVSATFTVDTRTTLRESDATSAIFPVDTRILDGLTGKGESGSTTLDTGGIGTLPVVLSIDPPQVPGLDTRQWITLTGRNFATQSMVVLRVGNEVYSIPQERTQFVDSTTLRVFVNVTSAAAAWTATVVNPGGIASQPLAFSVATPAVRPVAGLDFGTVAPGQSVVKAFVLWNTGTATADCAISGLGAPFALTGPAPGQLAPGAEATVSLSYSPTASGRHDGVALLQIGGQSVARPLTGQAVLAPTGTGVVFGTVRGLPPVGTATAPVPLVGARVVLLQGESSSGLRLRVTRYETTTDSRGAYSLSQVPAGTYAVAALLDGGSDSRLYLDHGHGSASTDYVLGGIPVTITQGGSHEVPVDLSSRSTIPADPKNMPVVLVRGLRLNDEPETSYWFKLHTILELQHFTEVWDPNATSVVVDGTKGVAANACCLAEHLKARIADYTTRHGQAPAKVHFICHSMGGLIVRQLLHNNQSANNGSHLPLSGDVFMLATPNAGSLAADHPGAAAYAWWKDSDVSELRTYHVRHVFADSVRWPEEGTRLFLVTGDRTNGDPDLKVPHNLLQKGPPDDRVDDGAVTVLSNRGEYLEIKLPFHSGMANSTPMFIPATWEKGLSFNDSKVHPVGQQIVPLNHSEICASDQVIDWMAGILANPDHAVEALNMSAHQESRQAENRPAAAPAPPPELPRTLVDHRTGTVAAGGSVTHGFPVDATSPLVISLHGTSAQSLRLITPAGLTLGPESTDPAVVYDQTTSDGGTYLTCTLTAPQAGPWQAVVDATQATQPGAYTLEIEAESDLRLAVSHPEWRGQSAQTIVSAALGREGQGLLAIPDATLSMEVHCPDGTVLARSFSDLGLHGDAQAGDGLFGLLLEALAQPGEHAIVTRLEGVLPASTQAFRRSAQTRLHVAAPGGIIAGQPDWHPVDTNDDGRVDALPVTLLVAVDSPGSYVLSARLKDAAQDVEIHAVADFYQAAAGTNRAVLNFRPRDLPQGVPFGPFDLHAVKLFRRQNDRLVFLDYRDETTPLPVSLQAPFSRSIRLTGDLAFGSVPVGTQATRQFQAHNDGWQALQLSDLHLPAGFSASFADALIEPGSSAVLSVLFTPAAETAYTGVLTLDSDAQAGESTLPLSGQGTPAIVLLGDWLLAAGVPPAQRAPQDDPNADGIPNLLAYFLNIHPLHGRNMADAHASPHARLGQENGETYLTFTYRQNRLAQGLDATLEASPGLSPASWQTITPDRTLQLGPDPITGDPLIQLWIKTGPLPQRFFRLRVTELPR